MVAGLRLRQRIKDANRHVLVDTQGLLMEAVGHAADIQDRDGAVMLATSLFGKCRVLLKLYADADRFAMSPKRRIVERTIAWLNRC